MAIGFDRTTVDALVLYGYALEGLTVTQCRGIDGAVTRLGPGLCAAPHGDLSEVGSGADESGPRVTVVVGTVVGRARSAASEDATTQSATINDATCARARAAFDAARPHVDAALAKLGVSPGDDPGLFVVAAGPLASARLDGDPGATIEELPESGPAGDAVRRLDVSAGGGGDPVRVRLVGIFTLSARYD